MTRPPNDDIDILGELQKAGRAVLDGVLVGVSIAGRAIADGADSALSALKDNDAKAAKPEASQSERRRTEEPAPKPATATRKPRASKAKPA